MSPTWTRSAGSSASSPTVRPPARPRRGRPKGAFTQRLRFDELRTFLLQHPKGLTLQELAARVGISTRSARRYLVELNRALDLEAVPNTSGRAQRWRIVPAEIPRRVSVRRTQAYALLATRTLFAPLRGSTLYEEIDLAAQHLVGVARRPGRGPNAGVADARLEDRFLYLPFAPKDYSLLSEVVDDLFQAVADLRPLSLRYPRPEDGRLERLEVLPYALFLYKDAILFVGLDVGRSLVRTFLLDHTRDTQCATKRRFSLPADFRVGDYWHGQFGVGPPAPPVEVVIEFDRDVAEHVRTRVVHPTQRIESLRGGRVRLRMRVGAIDEVATWVLGFGAKAHVRAPELLADRVRDELRTAWERYANGATEPRPRASPARRGRAERTRQSKPAKRTRD